eukprot:1158063-Pelagomonas_calceolata.AAC.9
MSCRHFPEQCPAVCRLDAGMLEPGHGAHVSHANMPAPFLRACADVLEPSNGQGPPSQHASIPNHTCHAVFYLCLSCVHAQTCLSRAMARTNHPTGKTGKEVVPIVYSMRREMMNECVTGMGEAHFDERNMGAATWDRALCYGRLPERHNLQDGPGSGCYTAGTAGLVECQLDVLKKHTGSMLFIQPACKEKCVSRRVLQCFDVWQHAASSWYAC